MPGVIDGAEAPPSIPAGDLQLSVARFRKPVVYQRDGEAPHRSSTPAFVVEGDRVRFRVGAYDHSRPLVIDPVLSYATYLGGSGTDTIGASTGPGNLLGGCVPGPGGGPRRQCLRHRLHQLHQLPDQERRTRALCRPSSARLRPEHDRAFVSKFSPDGSSLVYSTFLGGNGADHAYAIAVDAVRQRLHHRHDLIGQFSNHQRRLPDGVLTDADQPAAALCVGLQQFECVGVCHQAEPRPAPRWSYSTFLGGYGYAYATAIAVDAAGRAYVAGNETQYCSTTTFKGCFPTTADAVITGDKTSGRSPQYAFVAAFDAAGARLLYSSLFGSLDYACTNGCGATWGTGITVDSPTAAST